MLFCDARDGEKAHAGAVNTCIGHGFKNGKSLSESARCGWIVYLEKNGPSIGSASMGSV